jgi:uncharacterized damage-inducible protein DinB
MAGNVTIGKLLIAECERRMFDESLPRLKKALGELSDDEIWTRPNAQSNSMGNLVLHLCGNVTQWIVSAIGGADDHRRRDEEFAARGPMPKSELLARLDRTMNEARAVIRRIDPASLIETRRAQGFDESIVSILIHVVEHFSYHTGQAAYHVKAVKGADLGFYRGVDLNRTAPPAK